MVVSEDVKVVQAPDGVVIEAAPTLSAMDDVARHVESFLEGKEQPMKVVNRAMVILDEVYSNIVHYSGAVHTSVYIDMSEGDPIFTFIDDGIGYNPLDSKPPDTSAPADKRPIGQLGIHITKNLSKSIEYEYSDGKNKLVVRLGP